MASFILESGRLSHIYGLKPVFIKDLVAYTLHSFVSRASYLICTSRKLPMSTLAMMLLSARCFTRDDSLAFSHTERVNQTLIGRKNLH